MFAARTAEYIRCTGRGNRHIDDPAILLMFRAFVWAATRPRLGPCRASESISQIRSRVVPHVALNRAASQCPLWVKSRHRSASNQCPLYPQKRTSELGHGMSALCQKRTSAQLFDHLVGGGEQCGRDRQSKRLGGFEVNDQLELSCP